jgi:type I restriction enzyme S subunit
VKVVKIANMKNGFIDLTEAEYVSEEFFESVKDKAGINQGDILLCCTGKVSLGKIDYYDLDEPSILSVDSYIIRVNEEKVHPLFFTYFFRGILGAYQIERDYTGTTNQIHLYESQIRGFRLPKINIRRQQKIVDQVKKSLDAQREIKNQIEEKQNEISKIIENAIEKSSQLSMAMNNQTFSV